MKNRLLFITLVTLFIFFYNFLFGQNYQVIYSCNFEDGEDITNWELETAEDYTTMFAPLQVRDKYNIGYAVAFDGKKSLYTSNDLGNTNIIDVIRPPENSIYSMADLKIYLTAGKYELSFAYRCQNPQSIMILLSDADNRFSLLPSHHPVITSISGTVNAEWLTTNNVFTIPEGYDDNYFISFMYTNMSTPTNLQPLNTIESLTIDNIVIKKESILYNITTYSEGNGTITPSQDTAFAGEIITLDIIPETNYELNTLTALKEGGGMIEITNNQFTMPDDNVMITATFTEKIEPQTYTVSGTVTCNGAGVENVIISYLETSTSTNENGYYEFEVSENTNVTITPSLEGYEFLPLSITIDNVVQDTANNNFTASTTGIILHSSHNKIRIYPNPANETLYFSNETAFEIIDIQGKVLLKNENAVKFVDVSHFKSGIYFVKTGFRVEKFIKQ